MLALFCYLIAAFVWIIGVLYKDLELLILGGFSFVMGLLIHYGSL